MSRSIVSIILSSLFLLFLTAPTVILLIDDTADVSIFFTSNEEEEKKGQEKDKEKELFYQYAFLAVSDFFLNERELNLEYFFKNYPKPHLNLISPPPDLYSL